MSQKLLMHITYYMNPSKRLDNKHGIDKSNREFTDHVLHGVMMFLDEINKYQGFSKKDVILDINSENEDATKINPKDYPNINLLIESFNFENEHPFRLSTKHRLSIQKKINDYDWFGYAEDDTIIFKETIDYLLDNSIKLLDNENKVYTIPRLVYNENNQYFYSDIKKPSKLIKTINGNAIKPDNRFGACWFYPKKIMDKWIKNKKSFFNFDNPRNNDIRVEMGWGISEIDAIVPINSNNEPDIKCVHLGYCGKYYFPHPKGFHKLPINKICNYKS